jgi:hypothetical protein
MKCFIVGLTEGGKGGRVMARSKYPVEVKVSMGRVAAKPGNYEMDILTYGVRSFRLALEVDGMLVCVFDPMPSHVLKYGDTLTASISGDGSLWPKEEVDYYKL